MESGTARGEPAPPRSRTVRLREAASTIFALVALVPFLVLLFLLHRYGALREYDAQAGLLLALALAVLGFIVLQRLVSQVTRLADAVGTQRPTPEAAGAVEGGFDTVNGVGRVAEIGQIGSAFARMLDDLRSSTARLEDLVFKLGALNEIVELAARVSQIDELLTLVLERSMRTVRATAGSIMLIDDERRKLRVAAARGLPDDVLPSGDVALGEGVAGATAASGEPLIIDDVATDQRLGGAGSGALVAVPVRVEDRIIGVISLVRRHGAGTAAFSPTDLQFLATLMTHVGYSLDNARLLSETQETASRLTRAVRELQATQQRLVEGETLRAVGQMASGMAHHLNNLLAVSSGRIQLMQLRASDGELKRQLEIARQAMDDAADVVRRVLEFSVTQPRAGDTSVDLTEVVREVVELARPRWHDEAQLRGITIDVREQLGDVSSVSGDAAALREVVMNLVLNAVDALPRGGSITLRTWEADGEVHCSVTDEGAGMSDDVRRRAMEPFFTTKGPRGVGLGLSVSHAIVQRHRGDLTIDSAPARGTVAEFHIPHAGVIANAAERSEPDETGDRGARRILIVDDQREVREMLADALTAHGYDVEQASSGRQALDRLAAGESTDLILTDLGMPDMTGWEIAEAIRRRWPDLPVGLVTGWGARSEGTLEQRRSVAFIIAKPFTIDALLSTIARVPRRPRA